MVKQQISEGVKRFIREQIQTVPKLEVLLLLQRERSWMQMTSIGPTERAAKGPTL